MTDIMTVGVCGFGTMGAGIAELCSSRGHETTVLAKSEGHISRGFSRVEQSTARAEEQDKITNEQRGELLRRIHGTIDIRELRRCDLVIEAVTEDFEVKRALLRELDAICDSTTVLASTTSSLSITELGAVAGRTGNVVGMHFLNPAPTMNLLEIVRGKETEPSVVEMVRTFGESLGKVTLVVDDNAGFLVNRLLFPDLLDAVRLLESEVADRDDIDASMELGCNMPMGPLKLVDLIGVDVTKVIADNLYRAYLDERFRTPSLLNSMLAEGRLGRKVRKGFYDY